MFETEFPQLTCDRPSAVEHALKVLEASRTDPRRWMLPDNTAVSTE